MRVLSFIIFAFFLPGICISQSLEDSILKAIKLTESGKSRDAIALLDETIREFGDQPVLRLLKGEVYSGNERRLTSNPNLYQAALQEFNKAIELDSTFAPAYRSRALLHIFHQYFDLAELDLTQVIRYSEDDIETLYNAYSDRASTKFYLKNYQGAIDDYNTALSLQPGTSNMYSNLGIVYAKMNNLKKAEEVFNMGLGMDSLNVGLMNNLAMAYIWNDRPKDAIRFLDQALKIEPHDPLVHNNMGLALLKIKKPKEALQYITRSIELYPENAYAFKHLGMARLALKQKDQACDAWEKALNLGYRKTYDHEVDDLINKNCRRKR